MYYNNSNRIIMHSNRTKKQQHQSEKETTRDANKFFESSNFQF